MRLFRDGTNASGGEDASGVGIVARVRANLETVRSVVALGSARGGTGKSSILINLAAALALSGRKVGILDADLNSPSVLSMLAMKAYRGVLPAEWIDPNAGPLGLRVVGSNLLPDHTSAPISFVEADSALALDSQINSNGRSANNQSYSDGLGDLLSRVRYGALDLLLIDLAPGLEAFARINDLVPRASLIVVSHPSENAARANKPLIELARSRHATVLGIIENMAGFSCDSCHAVRPLMPQGEVVAQANLLGVPLLERLPFDPRLAESCDRGTIFVRVYADSPLTKQFNGIANTIGGPARQPLHPNLSAVRS